MKLEIPVRVYVDEIEKLIDELKHLQTYKFSEHDEQILIDRDEAVKIFADHVKAIYIKIYIKPEQRWIPCSKSMPKKNGDYLVTGKKGKVYALKYTDGRWYGVKQMTNEQAYVILENCASLLDSGIRFFTKDHTKQFHEAYELAMKALQKTERKRGRWLELTNTNHTYVCSVCRRMLVNITNGKNTITKNYPFCHCGADLREGEAE